MTREACEWTVFVMAKSCLSRSHEESWSSLGIQYSHDDSRLLQAQYLPAPTASIALVDLAIPAATNKLQRGAMQNLDAIRTAGPESGSKCSS